MCNDDFINWLIKCDNQVSSVLYDLGYEDFKPLPEGYNYTMRRVSNVMCGYRWISDQVREDAKMYVCMRVQGVWENNFAHCSTTPHPFENNCSHELLPKTIYTVQSRGI